MSTDEIGKLVPDTTVEVMLAKSLTVILPQHPGNIGLSASTTVLVRRTVEVSHRWIHAAWHLNDWPSSLCMGWFSKSSQVQSNLATSIIKSGR
jgi:hypothetical protein